MLQNLGRNPNGPEKIYRPPIAEERRGWRRSRRRLNSPCRAPILPSTSPPWFTRLLKFYRPVHQTAPQSPQETVRPSYESASTSWRNRGEGARSCHRDKFTFDHQGFIYICAHGMVYTGDTICPGSRDAWRLHFQIGIRWNFDAGRYRNG